MVMLGEAAHEMLRSNGRRAVLSQDKRTHMPAASFAGTDVTTFAIGDVQTSVRGARHAALLAKGGSSPWIRLPPGLRAPFGATSWQDEATDRKNLDLTDMPQELVDWLQALDRWAVEAAARDSEKLFRKKLSQDEIAGMYTPILEPGKGGLAADGALEV